MLIRRIGLWLLLLFVFSLGVFVASISPLHREAPDDADRTASAILTMPPEIEMEDASTDAEGFAVKRAEPRGDAAGDANDAASQGEAAGPGAGAWIVEGSVRALDGKPLGGVLVRAIPGLSSQFDMFEPLLFAGRDHDATELMGTMIDNLERSQMSVLERVRECFTNAEGRYRMELPYAEEMQIRAVLEGFDVQPTGDSRLHVPHGTEVLDFLAQPLADVRVDVRLPDGSHPRRALVIADCGTGTSYIPWTPSRARIQLPEGSWVLSACREGRMGEEGAEEIEVEVTPGSSDTQSIVLHVLESATVEGSVTWDQAELLGSSAPLLVTATRSDSHWEPFAMYEGLGNVRGRPPKLNYRLVGVPCGPQKIKLLLGSHLLCERELEVLAPVTRCDFEVQPEASLRLASFRVVDAQGRVVLDANVNVDDRETDAGPTVFPRGDAWVVAYFAKEGSPAPREVRLRATCPRFGTKVAKCSLDAGEGIEIRFEAAASLLVDARSSAANRVRALLRPRDADDEQFNRYESLRLQSAPGRWSWSRFQPGPYVLEIWKYDENSGFNPMSPDWTREVDLQSGVNEITVDL